MKNIITFAAHDNPPAGGGIVVYCNALRNLFNNSSEIEIKECEILPSKSKLGLRYNREEIKNYLKKENPDIIHLNGYTSLLIKQLVPIAKKLGIKLVYTPHWHPFKTMRSYLLKKLYFDLFIKPYLRFMDAIICINKEDFSFFKRFSNKVHLIPHWIETEKLTLKDNTRIKNQILFVGSLVHPNKGFSYLYNLPINKYQIICVGRGDAPVRADMTHLYNISQAELRKLYAESSLVVIPSKYEAFSYVAMEALNAGTPVVMSEQVRIADFLPNFDGIKIFHLNSPEQFVSSVQDFIGKDFDNSLIKELFSEKSARERYTKLYNSILKND